MKGINDKAAANLAAKQKLEETVRQGQDTGINAVDQNNKRTGWSEAIFGQDKGYREAQQRAVRNSVNQMYMESASAIEDSAGDTPDEYREKLALGMDSLLEPYAGDDETRTMVEAAWLDASEKLSAAQAKEHYAFTQAENRATWDAEIQQSFDTFNVEGNLASTPEEFASIAASAESLFSVKDKPAGMSKSAWRASLNEALNTQLREGNINAHNLAKGVGWEESLTLKERVSRDKAISAYDTDFANQVNILYETIDAQADDIANTAQASALYRTLDKQLNELAVRSSGTNKAKLALARGHSSASGERKALRNAGIKLAKKAAKAEAKAARTQGIVNAVRISDSHPIEGAAQITEYDPTKKELTAAYDATIEEAVRDTLKKPDMSSAEVAQELMTNTALARIEASRWRNSDYPSNIVKIMTGSLVGGFEALADPDTGTASEELKQAVANVSLFAKDDVKFKKMLGNKYDDFEMIRRGVANGVNLEKLSKEITDFHDTSTKAGGQGSLYSKEFRKKHGGPRGYVSNLVKNLTNQRPTDDAVTQYMDRFNRGLQIYGNDISAASDYVKRDVFGDTTTYKGRKIAGTSALGLKEYSLPQLLDGVQRADVNLMSAAISILGGDPNTGMTSLDQVSDWTMQVTEGGLVLDAPTSKAPVPISHGTLAIWELVLKQRNNFVEMTETQTSEVVFQTMEEERKEFEDAMPSIGGWAVGNF